MHLSNGGIEHLDCSMGGKEGKGERRMCCDAGTEAVLKIAVHTYTWPSPIHGRGTCCARQVCSAAQVPSERGRAEGGPLLAHQQERMDVLAARNQTSVRNQLAGDWLQPRWEWSGHIFPILSHTVFASICQPPLPLDFLQCCYCNFLASAATDQPRFCLARSLQVQAHLISSTARLTKR